MRLPPNLTREELLRIAYRVQCGLNGDTSGPNRNKDVRGADFVQTMLELIDELGMTPDE